MTVDGAAWIVLRLAFGGLFLYTGWTLATGWTWTVENTALLVGSDRAPLFSAGAVGLMIGGGSLVLLGLFGQIGALLVLIFLVPGTLLHRKERDSAFPRSNALQQDATSAGRPLSTLEAQSLNALAGSAYAAHLSNVYKNLSLIGVAIFFVLAGTGPYSTDCAVLHLDEFFHHCGG